MISTHFAKRTGRTATNNRVVWCTELDMTSLCQLYTRDNYPEWCRVVVVFDCMWCAHKGETYLWMKVELYKLTWGARLGARRYYHFLLYPNYKAIVILWTILATLTYCKRACVASEVSIWACLTSRSVWSLCCPIELAGLLSRPCWKQVDKHLVIFYDLSLIWNTSCSK